ncbi:MAG: DUF4493 domain-containing protein [Bacteroidales bacterium]|nr:DUF4493 domain-containing protein [Bacteroidales bacterium]
MPRRRDLRFGFSLATATLMAAGLVGCADENPWGGSSDRKGSIDISLIADSDIKSAAPTFIKDDDNTRAEGDPNDLHTYTNVPAAEDFSIKLEKVDGSYSKTWTSLSAFKKEAENQFVTGAYTLTAFYGEKEKTDFGNPYFETSTTFTVLANETQKLNLNAGLCNSMVKINFTDEFVNYMSDYYVGIRSEGQPDEFRYASGEYRPVFVQPENANLTVHFTAKDTGLSGAKSLGQFIPLAKTLHNLTLDVRVVNGHTGLGVIFDDSLEEEDIFIDLSDGFADMAKAPVISCTGFENGATVNLLEGAASQSGLGMSVVAEAGIASAKLTVKSIGADPAWGREIDLCKATLAQQQQLAEAGIKAVGFFTNPDKAANIDLTQYSRSLTSGSYNISLEVVDKNSNISDPAGKVIFDLDPIRFENANGRVAYGSSDASLTLDYNGLDPMDIMFKSPDTNGNDQDVVITSCGETRAFDTKNYTYALILPSPATQRKVEVKAYNKNTGRFLGTCTLELDAVPGYQISAIDAFSKFAYMKVTADNPALLATITENIRLDNSNLFIYSRDTANGILTVTGPKDASGNPTALTPGGSYPFDYSIFAGDFSYGKKNSFATESELPIPNGDFENLTETINTTMNQGGRWTITKIGSKFQTSLSILIKEPTGWFSSNPTTCNLSASNVNSWYVIPSVYNTTLTWESNQPDVKIMGMGQSAYKSTADIYKSLLAKSGSNAMVIRNVAWDNNGNEIEYKKQTGNTEYSNYYCSNKPSSIANRTAGYLKLGSASSEGASFSSRPTLLKGWFKYQPDNQDPDEKGLISVKLLNGSEVIGSGSIELGSQNEYTEFSIPITYVTKTFGKKATSLQIAIYSSNKTSDIKTTDYCNKEECCSRGASLTVDNLTFEYK